VVVTRNGELIVRAPYNTPLPFIEHVINRKSLWIIKKLNEAASMPQYETRKFSEGELFMYLGNQYPLSIIENNKSAVRFVEDTIYISSKAFLNAERNIIRWYQTEAYKVLTERTEYFSASVNMKPSSIRLSGAKRRWGSCGRKGNINYNWRLIMAPLEILDYIVVHELAHLRHHNHSKQYWNLVFSIMPEYKSRELWLKKNGHLLNL
jgi:hypothetical protein